MISFEEFALEDGSPIYWQIIRHVKRGIIAGTVADGDEMPSRRVLSALLGVNPNTIQKAYRLLEEEGLVESRSGAKSCITAGPEQIREIRGQLLEAEAGAAVKAMRQMGLTKADALFLVEKIWDSDEVI